MPSESAIPEKEDAGSAIFVLTVVGAPFWKFNPAWLPKRHCAASFCEKQVSVMKQNMVKIFFMVLFCFI